jgi:N-acetylglucosamine-6-sulfatase
MMAVDEMVASLVQELEVAGELDNTFIFFTSDNGYHQGEHRIDSGRNTPYEETARVPLFVRGPGVPAGSKVEKLALNTDFASTFADLAGIEFPADGRSLAPLLRGEDARVAFGRPAGRVSRREPAQLRGRQDRDPQIRRI